MSRRGFTLIELILALTMVAMLTLAVYTGLATAVRARNVAATHSDSMRQAKAALDLVEQELRSVVPPGGLLAGAFTGTPTGSGDSAAAYLDFYTLGSDLVASPAARQSDGVRHVQLLVSSDGTMPVLTRTITRELIDLSAAAPETDTLAKDVVSFAARYYADEQWNDSWDSTQANNLLPAAIEISVGVRAPLPGEPQHVYRLTRVVPMTCGVTAAAEWVANDTAPSLPGLDQETTQ